MWNRVIDCRRGNACCVCFAVYVRFKFYEVVKMEVLQKGNIHQGNEHLFPEYHAKQCCAISVMCMAYAHKKNPEMWNSNDVDSCLFVRNFNKSMKHICM